METVQTIEEITQVFEDDDIIKQMDFLKALPPSSMRETAAGFLGIGSKDSKVTALDILATEYSVGKSFLWGLNLAKVCYNLSVAYFEKYGPGPANAYLLSAGRSAISVVSALQKLGKWKDLIEFGEKAYKWLKSNGEGSYLYTVQLYIADGHIDLQNFDQASEILNAIKIQENLTYDQKYTENRIKGKFDLIIGSITELPSNESFEKTFNKDRIRMSEDIMQALSSLLPTNTTDLLREKVKDLSGKSTLGKEENYEMLVDQYNKLAQFLTGSSVLQQGDLNEITASGLLQKAGLILMNEQKGYDDKCLRETIESLNKVKEWSVKNNLLSFENDSLWSLYLCHKRLNLWEDGAKLLKDLRKNIEYERGRISDPFQRGNLMIKYPFLYAELCKSNFILGKSEELFDAIEGAKGKALADILTIRDNKPYSENQIGNQALPILKKLTKQYQFHYLTYFVDDDITYSLLVSKEGEVYTHAIEIKKEELRKLVKYTDPRKWGKLSGIMGSANSYNLTTQLTPFLNLLEKLVQDDLIKRDDHICYSSDDVMHLIPLHYISFFNEPLIKYFSLSRVHGIHVLIEILNRKYQNLENFLCVTIPAIQDKKNEKKMRDYEIVFDFISNNFKSYTKMGLEIDLATIPEYDLKNKTIHCLTHGYFPKEDNNIHNPNPYESSGIILAYDCKNPDLQKIETDEIYEILLSPKKINELKLDFSGSHVTLQACVSGLSKEGVAGDAIGMDWILLMCGAGSLLTTHWDTDLTSSSKFVKMFYNKWLKEKRSKAQAWRAACMETMEDLNGSSNLSYFHWASFSLSGDWR